MNSMSYSATADFYGQGEVQIVVNDQGNTGGPQKTATKSLFIEVLPVADAPIFNGLDGTPAFTENGSAVVLDSNATIYDAELSAADNFSGATLQLSRNGGINTDDAFSATGTLSALTDGGSLIVGGVTVGTVTNNAGGNLLLTFNSNATNARVNSVIQQIAYSNGSDTPPSSVQIDWTFHDGALQTTGNTTVSITPSNDAPVLTGTTLITNGTFDTDLSGWTTNSGNIDASGGEVRFGQVGGANGVLSQTVSTTIGETYYVTFNYGDRSATKTQSLEFKVTGASTVLHSDIVSGAADTTLQPYHYSFVADSTSTTLTFTDTSGDHSGVRGYLDNVYMGQAATPDAPLSYTENDAPTVINGQLNLVDIDDGNLESAVVQITGNYANGEDTLSFVDQNGITGSWDSGAGTLTLSGSASISDYQTALRSITYSNFSDDPSALTRTVAFTVHDGDANSNIQTRNITITAVNDAPVAVNDSDSTPEDTAVVIDLTSNDVDPDSSPLYVLDVSNPTNGSVVNNNDGTVTYTPDTSYNGADSFTYVVSDHANLSSQWRLDGDATDTVGSNNGTVTGATTVEGAMGDALSFDEVDDHVVIPDFAIGNEFSLSFQLKIDDNTGSLFQYILSHGDVNNANSLNIFLNEDSHGTDPNKLRTIIRDTNDALDNTGLEFDASSIIGDGLWHTYTLTVESGVGAKVYLDGVLQNSDSTGGDAFDPTTDLFLGARQDLDSDRRFGGLLDSIKLFDKTLTASEVADVHTGGAALGTVTLSVAPTNTAPSDLHYTQYLGGGEFIVNSTTSDEQDQPEVITLSNGDFVVAWESTNQDGDSDGIYFQRYDSNGIAQGGETLVNVTTTDDQDDAQLAALSNGGFAIIWESNNQDGANQGIYARVYDASGTPTTGETLVNTTTADDQADPDVTALNGGGFVVVWESYLQDGDEDGIYSQRFDNNGVPQGSETQVHTSTVNGQYDAKVSALNDGGYLVTWDNDSSGDTDVMAQRFDASGAPVGSETKINTTTISSQDDAKTVVLNSGDYVIVWESSGQDSDGEGLYGQRFDATGTPIGGEFSVNSTTTDDQMAHVITALDNGGFLVVWQSNQQDGSSHGIFAQQFDAIANKINGEFQINVTTANSQADPSVTLLQDGRLVVVYESNLQDGSSDTVVGRIFTPSLNENSPNGTAVAVASQVVDPDVGDSHTYSLINDAGGAFEISTSTGTITVKDTNLIDFESTSSMSVTVRVEDSGGLTHDEVVSLAINDINEAPVNTVPGAQSVNEDTSLAVSGISVTDADDNLDTVQLSVGNGVLNVTLQGAASISAGANASSDLTLSGSLADINSTLATLTYQGDLNFTGSDTLTVLSTDTDAATDSNSVNITVNAVNDAPVVSAPAGPLAATEQLWMNFEGTGFSIADADGLSGNLTATLHVTQGAIDVTVGDSGVTINSGDGTHTVVLEGTETELNSLLTGSSTGTLAYRHPSQLPPASATLSLTVDDQGNTGTDPGLTGTAASEEGSASVVINITSVNDAPKNTVPGTQTALEETPLAITGISISDADENGGNLTTRLQVSNGTLNITLSGGAIISSGINNSGDLTIQGSRVDINTVLASLTYTGNTNVTGTAADTLTVTTNDLGNTGTGGAKSDVDTVQIDITAVNDAPVIAQQPGGGTYNENGNPGTYVDITTTITDSDGLDFDGGVLTTSISANGEADDRLHLVHEGSAIGEVGISGSDVTYNFGAGAVVCR